MQRAPPTPSAAKPEELFLLILGAALITAPLCRLLRKIGERLRDQCCDDDDDEVVEHADEGEGEDEGVEREVDEEREGEECEEV